MWLSVSSCGWRTQSPLANSQQVEVAWLLREPLTVTVSPACNASVKDRRLRRDRTRNSSRYSATSCQGLSGVASFLDARRTSNRRLRRLTVWCGASAGMAWAHGGGEVECLPATTDRARLAVCPRGEMTLRRVKHVWAWYLAAGTIETSRPLGGVTRIMRRFGRLWWRGWGRGACCAGRPG